MRRCRSENQRAIEWAAAVLTFYKAFAKTYFSFRMSTTIIHKFYFSFFFFFKKEITTAIIINKNKPIITQPPGSKLAKKSIYITSFHPTDTLPFQHRDFISPMLRSNLARVAHNLHDFVLQAYDAHSL